MALADRRSQRAMRPDAVVSLPILRCQQLDGYPLCLPIATRVCPYLDDRSDEVVVLPSA